MSTNKAFIAVHAGAGYHSKDKEKDYRIVCKNACLQAMEILKNGGSALSAVTMAVSVLEDSPLTNAGIGSNLTLDGRVECDASVMDGKTLTFGAVGCVSGVRNPVCAARRLVDTQLTGPLSLGRIPPSILVGSGAEKWAREQNLSIVKENVLITEASRRMFTKYKRKLDRHSERRIVNTKMSDDNRSLDRAQSSTSGSTDCSNKPASSSDLVDPSEMKGRQMLGTSTEPHRCSETSESSRVSGTSTNQVDTNFVKRRKIEDHAGSTSEDCQEIDEDEENIDDMQDGVQDTVGAVCVDEGGNMAAAASSGGIWLKQSGRLGPAAHFGAGCWAHNGVENTPGVAVATSGGGEYLIKTMLARACAESVQATENASLGVTTAFKQNFLESEFLSNVESKNGGVLVLKHTTDGTEREGEVLWAHTTDSMCIGYMLHSHSKPTIFVSRLPAVSIPGKSFAMEGKNFRLQSANT